MLRKRTNLLKNLFTLCLTILVCSGVQVLQASATETHVVKGMEPKQSGDFKYQYCEICKGIAIIEYTGTDKVVQVPKTIEGIQVKELAHGAFAGNDTIIECILPEGMVSLGTCSFLRCDNLKKVNVPEGITYLLATFQECKSLTTVSLPSTLLEIGADTFNECKSLTSLAIPDNVQVIGQRAFRECENLQNIKLPSKLKSIGERAFKNCKKLKKIEIPDSVWYVNNEAFIGCSALRKVTLPHNLYRLDYRVFMNCTALKEITLPSNLAYIGQDAFYKCKRLKKITFEGSALEWVGSKALKGIHKKAVIDVPKKAVKKYKKLFDKSCGYQKKTMRIK